MRWGFACFAYESWQLEKIGPKERSVGNAGHTRVSVNWRALLPKSTTEHLYAKHAKPPEPNTFVGVLHTEPPKVEGAPEQTVSAPAVPEVIRSPIHALSCHALSWAEWKTEMLNQLFQEQGRSGQRGRITPTTVRHGERAPWVLK